MSYSLEVRANCRSLFIESGLSFEQVSADTGVSVSQLKAWAKDGAWTSEREKYEREYLQLSGGLQTLKIKMLNDAVASVDPQKIYALANLLKATQPRVTRSAGADRAALFVEFLGKFIDYLKGVDGEALRYLEPHLRGFAEVMKQPETT